MRWVLSLDTAGVLGGSGLCANTRIKNNAYIYIIQSLIAPPPYLPIVLELMQILFRKLNITFLQIESRKTPALSPGHLPKFKPLHINNSDDHGLPSLPSNIDTYNPLSYLVYSFTDMIMDKLVE
jgi:hypothetical protein